MAKVGTNHKTGVFGDAAEFYVGRLFSMSKRPSGDIRPDLYVDPQERDYGHNFSVEVKGGNAPRGVSLVMGQLTLGVNNLGQWGEFFGRRNRGPTVNGRTKFVSKGERVFYAAVERKDGIKADDLVGDYATVRLNWGDVWFLPADLVFHYHAAVIAGQLGEPISRTEVRLRRMLKKSVETGSALSAEWDGRQGYWESLPFSSCKAIFEGRTNGVKHPNQKKTLERFFRAARSLTSYDGYSRTTVKIPGDRQMYFVYDPQDEEIVSALKQNVKRVRQPLEAVRSQREQIKEWMEKDEVRLTLPGFDHYHNGFAPRERKYQLVARYQDKYGIDLERLDLLERLVAWETAKQHALRSRNEAIEEQNKLDQVPF